MFFFSDYGKDEPANETKEPQPPVTNVSNVVVNTSGERQSKRARRTRHDTLTGLDTNITETLATEHVLRSAVAPQVTANTTQKKANTGTGKEI